MKKRIVAALMLLAMFVAMIPASFADEETSQSVVLRDLQSMTFDGEPWNIEDYPVDTSDVGCYCIAVDEVGFRKDGNLNNYAFYLYVYNPSGREIVSTSASNRVQMAVAWDKDGQPTEYEKFRMTLISVSSEAGYENVFYKFRVEDRVCNYDGLTMKQRLLQNKSRREYDVSGFELLMKQSNEIKDYAVGCNVIVRGYDAGCGDGNAESSKEIRYVAQQTLTLDVQQAYWRTQSSSKGVNHKHQINSAYFSIPNEVWDQYKELYSIKCEWEEHHTTPMIVTDDQTLYDDLRVNLFTTYEYSSTPPVYGFYTAPTLLSATAGGILPGKKYYVDYAYNFPDYLTTGSNRYDTYDIDHDLKRLAWLFKASDEIQLNKESITVDEIVSFYKNWSYMGDPLFLENTVDEGREEFRNGMTIYFDELTEGAFDLSNYDSNHGWLQRFIDYGVFNGGLTSKGYTVDIYEVYPDFTPIEIFRQADGSADKFVSDSITGSEIAKKHFFNDEDQAIKFRDFVKEAIANDETVVLFRYASTDYYSESLIIYPQIDGHAYFTLQTFFKNFDVIQMQFKAEDMSLATVAVVSDPSHGTGGGQAPPTSTDSDLVKDQWDEDWQEVMNSLKGDLGQIFKWLIIVLVVCALTPLVIMAVNMLLNLFTGGGSGGSSGGRRRNYIRKRRK